MHIHEDHIFPVAQYIAARSQGLYKAEESIPCYSNLDQITTPASKLVTLQRVKKTLDTFDNDLDQRLPAQDPPPPAQETQRLNQIQPD